MKYLYSVLTSTLVFFFLCTFSHKNETTNFKCKEIIVNNDNSQIIEVERKSSLNNHEELLEVKKIVQNYLSGNAADKLEDETIKFLKDILSDIDKKLDEIKD